MISGPLGKHKFSGIGAASASVVLAAFATNPGTAFLASGISGKIIHFILTRVFSGLASLGLVILNVGASRLETVIDGKKMDGAWDSADEFIAAIRATGRDLTPEEVKKIDEPVIAAFRKWAKFGKQAKKK